MKLKPAPIDGVWRYVKKKAWKYKMYAETTTRIFYLSNIIHGSTTISSFIKKFCLNDSNITRLMAWEICISLASREKLLLKDILTSSLVRVVQMYFQVGDLHNLLLKYLA